MAKKSKSSMNQNIKAPEFLKELLLARSPSGYEEEARTVVERNLSSIADDFFVDALGSCHATLEAKGDQVSCLPVISTNLDSSLSMLIQKDFCTLTQLEGTTEV